MVYRVVVAMSGGVDSAVAANLLIEQGYEVIGVHMKVWDVNDSRVSMETKACYSPNKATEIENFKRICNYLKIESHVIDVSSEYKKVVLGNFSSEYSSGRTPNPCVVCNKKIKFGYFIDELSKQIDFNYVATGHYVKVHYDKMNKRYFLTKAKDLKKDQTYFLYGLSQEQLAKVKFPLGDMLKKEVKELSSKFELGLEKKAESQNFIEGDYGCFIEEEQTPGNFIDKQGKVLGKHRGLAFYTIGQRKGLGVFAPKPLYVVNIDKEKNAIILGEDVDLYKKELVAEKLNWQAIESFVETKNVTAKIRYAMPFAKVKVEPLGSDKIRVVFDEPQRAITSGQSVVLYDGDIMLGGGVIKSEK